MAIAVVTIICIAMIVVGGMTLSQGMLTSADAAAVNFDKITVLEGEITRTDLDIFRAAKLSWADYLRVTVKNSGQVKLASFDKWDVIVNYTDTVGTLRSTWLLYSDVAPADNEWQKARLGLEGPIEFFEPGILNPAEEMVTLINLEPPSGNATSGSISMAAPNGVYTSFPFLNLGYTRLTPNSENITLNSIKYYELVEATPADGITMTIRTNFLRNQIARRLLYNVNESTRPARFIFSLVGISQIPAKTWTVYYRGFIPNGFLRNAGDRAYLNINIRVLREDGTVRANITAPGVGVAEALITRAQEGDWITVSGTYNFLGYMVVDENDYLEIAFYGQTKVNPNAGYIQLSIDDNTLPIADQTRIEA
jgi:hypothetical protein